MTESDDTTHIYDDAVLAAAEVAAEVDAELEEMTDRIGRKTVDASRLHFRRIAALQVFAALRQEAAVAA